MWTYSRTWTNKFSLTVFAPHRIATPSWWTWFHCISWIIVIIIIKKIPLIVTSGSAEQQVAGFAVRWVRLHHQQAEDCGRGMARSFLRPPFMCAYGGNSSRDGRIVTPAPVPSPEPAARPGPDSPLAACWPGGCLSVAALDVQGEDGELGASEGAGGASALGEGGVCWGTGVCCGCVEEGGSRWTSSVLSILSMWRCGASAGLLSAL